MRIVWSPLAVDRVAEIADYIAQDNPDAAAQWVEATFAAVGRLETFPESGRMVPEIRRKDFRELMHGNYRIVYRIEKEQISILTVRHAKQILPVDEIS